MTRFQRNPLRTAEVAARSLSGTENKSNRDTYRILFVCSGNICRSPACRGVMEKMIARRGLSSNIQVDSAGIVDDRVGEKPAWRMRWAAFLKGYRMSHRSRLVTRKDLERFDMVIALDRDVLAVVRRVHSQPRCEFRLLSDFLPSDEPVDVPDPVNQSLYAFRTVLNVIEKACTEVLEQVTSQMAVDAVVCR
jgi:protein-tyrosine phosphatase